MGGTLHSLALAHPHVLAAPGWAQPGGAHAAEGGGAGGVGAGLGPSERHLYECPLYRASARTLAHFVCAVELPSAEPSDKWVLRGVCLLTHPAPNADGSEV